MSFLIQWIDVIWLPLAWLVVNKEQRLWAVSTVLACMVMMRLLIELMESIGYPQGIIGLVSVPVVGRGAAIYTLFYAAYILFAFYSPQNKGVLFMAVSIAVFFASLFTFSFAMVL